MTNEQVRQYLLPPLFNAAVRAGAAIMEIYNLDQPYDITIKEDHTPIIQADGIAHRTIREYLGPTRIPVLSEEGREMLFKERRNWELYWLVDPLDGTMEFIKHNNEFTVNIALMHHKVCIAAVIYVPCYQKMYVAEQGKGSFLKLNIPPQKDADYTYEQILEGGVRLPFEGEAHHDHLKVGVSRSHQTPETDSRVDALKRKFPNLEVVVQGSSYKFCLLAEGTIDYYPRTSETYEWDTAAGELILSEAGGLTRSLPDGEELLYNEEDLRNPWFECCSPYCPILK